MHPAPEVLYEDNHVLALHKPAGMPSQPDESGDQSLLEWATEYIRVKYSKPGNVYVGLLHRLDRPVGGVMVFAKTSKAASRLSEQLRDRGVRKIYRAVTKGVPEAMAARLEHFIGPATKTEQNIMRAFKGPGPDRKPAVLMYRCLQSTNGLALLEIELETGRKHQIRTQLTAIGCPIIGDVKYGAPDFLPDKSIALAAYSLTLDHPVTKEKLKLTAPLPTTYPWNLFPS